MRQVAEEHAWADLLKQKLTVSKIPRTFTLPGFGPFEIRKRCTIIAGLNGAGKSRALKAISEAIPPDEVVYLRLHEACERIRLILSSRDDIEQMESEVGPLPLSPELKCDIERIIARDYESLDWYSLDLEGTEPDASPLLDLWSESYVPHFRAGHRGQGYSSLDMGLGEFSVHLLYWVLQQYKDQRQIFLLLDEPDAYLPPGTRFRLLANLMNIARAREWYLVISTHSEVLIDSALQNEALVYLLPSVGSVDFLHAHEHPLSILNSHLPPSAKDVLLFCEDESGAALTRAFIALNPALSQRVAVVWKDGDGYLNKLHQHLPRNDAMPIKISLVFDGDLRCDKAGAEASERRRWPRIYLPTTRPPDDLLRQCKEEPALLAAEMRCDLTALRVKLMELEGSESHDWVNSLCEWAGSRPRALQSLATLWARRNDSLAREFLAEVSDLVLDAR